MKATQKPNFLTSIIEDILFITKIMIFEKNFTKSDVLISFWEPKTKGDT